MVINVELLLADPDRAHGDSIANVLNYDIIHDGIVDLAGSKHFNLQETLVEAILDLCLAQSQVVEARVSTRSPTSTRIAASATRRSAVARRAERQARCRPPSVRCGAPAWSCCWPP